MQIQLIEKPNWNHKQNAINWSTNTINWKHQIGITNKMQSIKQVNQSITKNTKL